MCGVWLSICELSWKSDKERISKGARWQKKQKKARRWEQGDIKAKKVKVVGKGGLNGSLDLRGKEADLTMTSQITMKKWQGQSKPGEISKSKYIVHWILLPAR